jgi:glycopeptide antibiotics resistance protein
VGVLLTRRVLLPTFAIFLLAVVYLVLSPRSDTADAGVVRVLDALRAAGFVSVTSSHVEVALNVLLFVPLTLVGGVLLPRVPWWLWVCAGFVVAGLLESAQWVFLPSRSAKLDDLVANTLGGVLGVLTLALIRREVDATTSGRTSRPSLVSLRVLAALALGLVLLLVLVVFSPSSDLQGKTVTELSKVMLAAGIPEWLATFTLWERVMNVLLFVPLGVLGALGRPGWTMWRWAAVGVALSLAIEVVQGLLLPARDASVLDVAMNALGVVVGAAGVLMLFRGGRSEARPLTSRSAAR